MDLLLDPDWGVWLLEANAEPDLSKAGDRLQGVIDKILQDTLSLVIDQGERFAMSRDQDAADARLAKVRWQQVFQRQGRAF